MPTFLALAQLRYPWMPPELLDAFAKGWAETGDPDDGLAAMRDHPRYLNHFPGIRRDDGSLRLNEAEYLSTMESYRLTTRQYGLNPDLFQQRYVELIEGEVSSTEFDQRMRDADELLRDRLPEVGRQFSEFFGINFTPGAIFAAFIDPDIGNAILDRRVSIASISGEGSARGFSINRGLATRLFQAGLTRDAATGLFSEAATAVPTLNRLGQRHEGRNVGVREFLGSRVFGEADPLRRERSLLAAEQSLFRGGLRFSRTNRGVRGIRPE